MIKYVVYPGYVRSENDDINFVRAEELMKLYNVNPEECIVYNVERRFLEKNLIPLRPKYDGDYII